MERLIEIEGKAESFKKINKEYIEKIMKMIKFIINYKDQHNQ